MQHKMLSSLQSWSV